ncbi:MAG: hypothetical protein AMXMBFR13_24260 [Phycisphaerae bacterium]
MTRDGLSSDDWRERLDLVVQTMREMSRQTDPQQMVRAYSARMRQLNPTDRMVAVSRRDLEPPKYRITRSSIWKEDINPWRELDRLPLLEGGLLGELLYGDEPRIIGDLAVPGEDPAAEYFTNMRSLLALPLYDGGTSLNMVVLMRREPGAFDNEQLADWVWMSNLFGRATQNLVLHEELREAYDQLDQEMQVVADIQRSLLPAELPRIQNLKLAAHYETSSRAGGDYYDFFRLPDGRWGIMIADVSGHGTPAAVMMAITHSIAHTYPGPPTPPGRMLRFVNAHLAARYTGNSSSFVTAFYGIWDPARRELTYACAGHNPPRLKRCGAGGVDALDAVQNLPLGIMADEAYSEAVQTLHPGDELVLYTDGITESAAPSGELFGLNRLDAVLGCCRNEPAETLAAVLDALRDFTRQRPPADDRTLITALIS